MLNVILALCGLILFILSLVVVYSNYKAPVNRWLSAFTFSGVLWLIANLSANLAKSNTSNLYFSRLTLVGASLTPLCFLLFCYNFTGRERALNIWKYIAIFIPVIVLLVTTPSALNIASVSQNGNSIQPGISYLGLLIISIIYFTFGISLLIKEFKSSQQARRQQLYYVLLGTLLTIVPIFTFSGLLPILGFSQGLTYSPIAVIFFSAFTSIAIIRHRLLDIRLIVARSLAYAFSIASLATIFATVAFTITSLVFRGNTISSTATRWLYTVIAVGLAYFFPYTKRFFDKTTNKIFYRDAYDSQAFLDEFNKNLVTTYELSSLLRKSAKIIEDNLKPVYTVFGIKETENTPRRIIGTVGHPNFSEEDIAFIRSLTPKMNRKLIVVDELEERYKKLQETLRENNVSVIARLASSVKEEGIGYLVLGPKKSGNPYSSQDLNITEIVANELVIAIQNSLRFEEIQNFNLTLQQKVVDATKKLRKTNQRLEELDETKDDFISMASHQLRTPLTSVKGYLSMVLEGDAGKVNTTQIKMLHQAFTSSQRMVFLITDLLNVSTT